MRGIWPTIIGDRPWLMRMSLRSRVRRIRLRRLLIGLLSCVYPFYLYLALLPCCQETQETDRLVTYREYPIDPSWTLDGSSAGWNRVLSDQDKKFIMQRYPKTGIVRTTNDGVYLVNCFKGNQISSGIAYYSFLGNNDGQQPTSYINVTQGSNVVWEGTPGSGIF